jgi:hypothetical protein
MDRELLSEDKSSMGRMPETCIAVGIGTPDSKCVKSNAVGSRAGE